MARCRVVVTLPDAPEIMEIARSNLTLSAADHAQLGLQNLPQSFALDANFSPKPIRHVVAHEIERRSPRTNVVGHHSLLVRGSIDESELERASQFRDPAGKHRIFSDPKIEMANGVAFGDPPVGTIRDVQRILNSSKLNMSGFDGAGVAVAFIDGGVNGEFLASKGLSPNIDLLNSWTSRNSVTPGMAAVGHGSMCAFIALSIAPKITLLDFPIAQTEAGTSSVSGFLSDVIAVYGKLLLIAKDLGGALKGLVANNSWALSNPNWDFPPGTPGRFFDKTDHPFQRSGVELAEIGADQTFAAGNCGLEAPQPSCAFAPDQPRIVGASAYSEVLTVAAADIHGRLAGYSSPGPGAICSEKPDITAFTHFLGSEAFGPGQPDAGTSAATPIVSGVIAALRSKLPFDAETPATYPSSIRKLLIAFATPSARKFDFHYGNGLLSTDLFWKREPKARREANNEARLGASQATNPTSERQVAMADPSELKWQLLAEGSFEEIQRFFLTLGRSNGASQHPTSDAPSSPFPAPRTPASRKVYRGVDNRVEAQLFRAKGDPGPLLQAIRNHWALLREKQLADAQPIKIVHSPGNQHSVTYMFCWKTTTSKQTADSDPEVVDATSAIRNLASGCEVFAAGNEVYQGFERKRFPAVGGIELLRGKCTCRVKLDGVPEEFELDGQNGFVIMHRGAAVGPEELHADAC